MIRRILLSLSLVGLLVACGSSDTPPENRDIPDAGVASDTDAGDLLPFMSMCETDEECETGLCFPFNANGPHCTHACETDLECEDPSPGCNGMGVCKRPH